MSALFKAAVFLTCASAVVACGRGCPEGGTACNRTTPSTDESAMPTSSIAPPSAPMPGAPDAGRGAK